MFLVNLKKQLIIVISLLIVLVSSFVFAKVKGSDGQVYIEMYDKNLNHITNIIDVKYEYTRRVYDFDTSNFSGVSDEEVENALIFVLCDEYGNYMYSGFVKNLSQDGKLVKFKGEDLRTIIDTEIFLDFTTEKWYYVGDQTYLQYFPSTLSGVFQCIVEELEEQMFPDYENLPIEFIYPRPIIHSFWMCDFGKAYTIQNAYKFLKPYLAYYNYYIDSSFDRVNKKIVFEIKKHDTEVDIRLDDFIHERKTSSIKSNKVIAKLKFQTIYENTKSWLKIYSGTNMPDPTMEPYGRYDELVEQTNSTIPLLNADNFDVGYRIMVKYTSTPNPPNPPITTYFNWEVTNTKYVSLPDDLPEKTYYLGLDNQIYGNDIEYGNKVLPVKVKIFEHDYFAQAQFNAINELVNSRYNENIILTNVKCPLDLSTLKLNELINVYDKNGSVKSLPISEIINNNGMLQIKLGFKKTLFTEIIKN